MKRYKGQKKNQKSFVHYFYSIPANEEGKLFIKLLKKFLLVLLTGEQVVLVI